MKCTKCGQELPADAKFCHNCGTAVIVEHKCQICGKVNLPQAKFCVECGTSLIATAPTPRPQQSELTPTYAPTNAPFVQSAPTYTAPIPQPVSQTANSATVPEFDYSQYNLVVDSNGRMIKYKSKAPKIISIIFSLIILISAIISLVMSFGMDFVMGYEPDTPEIEYVQRIVPILRMVSIYATVVSLINFICSCCMSRGKGANIAVIVFSILSFNIVSFICGIVGVSQAYLPTLVNKKLYKLQLVVYNADKRQYDAAYSNSRSATAQAMQGEGIEYSASAEDTSERQISAKTRSSAYSPKTLTVFIIMTLYYIFLAVMGILGMVTDMDVLWTCEIPEVQKALNYVTGFLLIAVMPTYGIFFAVRAPFRIKNKTRIIIAISSLIAMVILDILFFVIKVKYEEILQISSVIFADEDLIYEGAVSDNTMLIFALFLSQVGIIALYVLGFFRISSEALDKQDYDDKGFTGIGLALDKLLNWLLNCVRAILRLKEENFGVFVLIGTVIFTLGLFITASLILAGLIILAVLVIVFVAFLGLYGGFGGSKVYLINDNGVDKILVYDDFGLGGYSYKDQNGEEWITSDSGISFYKANND